MTRERIGSNAFAATLFALLFTSVAGATLPRTWVSHTGSDANPCSATSPCATFSGALSKTAPNGEINCLDAGDFAPVTITQAVTIDCGGTFGSIIAGIPGQRGIDIAITQLGQVVTLRNLSINGQGVGDSGIISLGVTNLHVENVRISGFAVGIDVETLSGALVTVDNATISDCPLGIFEGTFIGTAVLNVNNSRIANAGSAVAADNGSRVLIRDSTIYDNARAVRQSSLLGTNLGSTVTVVGSTLGYSVVAALQSLSGEFILAFGNTFVNDVVIYDPNGGTIFTGSDNNNSGSTTGTANGGGVPKI